MRAAWPLLLVTLCTACTAARGTLLVQVVSPDYDAVTDVDRVEVEVRAETEDGPLLTGTFAMLAGTTLARPTRVYSASDLGPGAYAGMIRLFHGAAPVGEPRPFRVTVTGTTVFTALFSRLCEGVSCPGTGDAQSIACLAGRCVRPECSEDHPELCPSPDCATGTECGAPSVACATSVCTASGACVEARDDARCGPDERCHPNLGCVPLAPALETAELRFPLPGAHTTSVHAESTHRVRFRWETVEGAQSYFVQYALECARPLPTCAPTAASYLPYVAADVRTSEGSFETTDLDTQPVGHRVYFSVRACESPTADGGCSESPWSYVDVGRLRNDYDGDGYGDVAIGAEGGVSVFYGGPTGLEDSARTIIPAPFTRFEMTSADANGDGFADLIVSAPDADETSAGVFYGGAGGLEVTSYPNLATSVPQASADCCYPSALGDLDIDGYADFALVARGFDADPRSDLGAMFLFDGVLRAMPAQQGWLQFGYALGLPRDVVTVAYGHTSAAPHAVEYARFPVRIGSPGAGGRITGLPITDGRTDSSTGMETLASHAMLEDAGFGTALAAGDFDGDGTIELVASAPTASPAGALVVLGPGASMPWPRAFEGDVAASPRFGETLVPCDLDGDGDDELLVAAPETGSGLGRVYYYDYEGGVIAPLGRFVSGTSYGEALGCADVDGDGRESALIGAPDMGPGQGVFVVDQDGAITQLVTASIPSPGFGSSIAR